MKQLHDEPSPSVVVIGGGIAGLAAAWHLTKLGVPRVAVLEASNRWGGKLHTNEFAGADVDTGPDAFVARSKVAVELCMELGLEKELVSPALSNAYVVSRGRLRPFPANTLMGVPSSLRSLAGSGAVRTLGVIRASADLVLPASRVHGDVSVASALGPRLGRSVLYELIDPLVGGINGGSVDELSLSSAAPDIHNLYNSHRSLLVAARRHQAYRGLRQGSPVFYGIERGMQRLADALSCALRERRVDMRTMSPAVDISKDDDGGWSVKCGNGESVAVKGVILAVPAFEAARILRTCFSEVADILDNIRYASVSVVRLAYRSEATTFPLDGSGFVVPASEGMLTTACSWASSKWERLGRSNSIILRASVGRLNDTRAGKLSDRDLIARVHTELARLLGIDQGPIEADVTRWDRALPQYEPGHSERISRVDQTIKSMQGIALAGAAYHGLGIPACIKSGYEAASLVESSLHETGPG